MIPYRIKMNLLLIAFVISSVHSFIIHNETIFDSTKPENPAAVKNVTFTLDTSTHMMETLIDSFQSFSLTLNPKLKTNESDLEIRLYCEDGEQNSFDWIKNKNQTFDNCKILKLNPYEHDFKIGEASKNITFNTTNPGKQQLVVYAKWPAMNRTTSDINSVKAYITVNVGRSNTILIISSIIGWIYFAAWSISFYPQIWDNFKRKSVVGLNFDFIALNITGFISYSMFNVSLYAVKVVQNEYEAAHPRSQIPVQLNDVVFGVHAAFATLICIVQCFFYEKANQTISWFARIFLAVVWIGYVILSILCATTNVLNMLQLLNIFSYVKLVITIIKYIPQAWYNYQRKSTIGWSIGNIFLDSTGGFLSMCQMFLLAYNYDDWATIFYNFTKFGLGFISILFDVLFILQHYVFYRNSSGLHDSRTLLVDGAHPNRNNGNNPAQGSINTNTKDIRQPTDRLYDSSTAKLPHYTTEKNR